MANVIALTRRLLRRRTAPVLGIGVGSPGVVDLGGVVLTAPNLGWVDVDLQQPARRRSSGCRVIVANDANAAVLAEHSFGDADSDAHARRRSATVSAPGSLLGGTPLFGSRFAAGEIGHVVVGTDGGATCAPAARWAASRRG